MIIYNDLIVEIFIKIFGLILFAEMETWEKYFAFLLFSSLILKEIRNWGSKYVHCAYFDKKDIDFNFDSSKIDYLS